MKVDCAFLKAAGVGTRMGPIGKALPKVLWPIYELTLLELQIKYCQKLGIKDFYINVSHLSDVVIDFISTHNLKINILKEDPILGTGGCIHNLKSVIGDRRVLVVNADQFLFSTELEKCLENESDLLLISMLVKKYMGYNKLETSNNKLTRIVKNKDVCENEFYTFSGLSLINLKNLKYMGGESSFFETVANFKKEEVYVEKVNNFEYWDFGTLDRYYDSMLKLITKKDSLGYKFFMDSGTFVLENFTRGGYKARNGASLIDSTIYLDNDDFSIVEKGVVFEKRLYAI